MERTLTMSTTTDVANPPYQSGSRIELVDALRGFALMGIIIVHMLEQFIAAPRPVEEGWFLPATLTDNILDGLAVLLLQGKFFALFSILFGISFTIMMDSAAKKGESFAGRFMWRLLLLAGFGFINNMFYRGDILFIYALLGMCLPLLYRCPSRWLVAMVIFILSGLPKVIIYALIGGVSFMGDANGPASPELIEYLTVLKSGSLFDVAAHNTAVGLLFKLDFQFSVFSRGYATFAYFLVGILIYRSGLLQAIDEKKKRLKVVMWIAVVLMFLLMLAAGFVFSTLPEDFDSSWMVVVALSLFDFSSLAGTCFIASAFFLFYNWRPSGLIRVFQPYGRMALTNYVSQSIIGSFIFFGWGLGLLGEVSQVVGLGIGLTVIVVQVLCSHWWLKHFRYGPLEWLWRTGTYLKRVEIKRLPSYAEAN